jgi:hypothetical protein
MAVSIVPRESAAVKVPAAHVAAMIGRKSAGACTDMRSTKSAAREATADMAAASREAAADVAATAPEAAHMATASSAEAATVTASATASTMTAATATAATSPRVT